jgi:hypothetical protein
MIRHAGKLNLAGSVTIGLRALAWTLGENDRAERMLAVTGLDANDLRARAGEPALLAAVLSFLEAYEPDLIACADDLELQPAMLVAARERLES